MPAACRPSLYTTGTGASAAPRGRYADPRRQAGCETRAGLETSTTHVSVMDPGRETARP